MEKRRVGTRFIDREATEEDQAKPLMQVLAEKGITCSIMWHIHILSQKISKFYCDTDSNGLCQTFFIQSYLDSK